MKAWPYLLGALGVGVVGFLVLSSGTAGAAAPPLPAAPPSGADEAARRKAWVRRANFLACVADAGGNSGAAADLRIQAMTISDGVTPVPPGFPLPFAGAPPGCVE